MTVVAKVGALIAAVLLGLVAAGCGGGSSSSPSDQLSHFVVGYVDHNEGNCCELGMHATVDDVTFARGNPRWAFVTISVTDSNGKPDGRDFLVVRKIGETWHVLGFGKGSIGCQVPVRIRAALARGVPKGALDCAGG